MSEKLAKIKDFEVMDGLFHMLPQSIKKYNSEFFLIMHLRIHL